MCLWSCDQHGQRHLHYPATRGNAASDFLNGSASSEERVEWKNGELYGNLQHEKMLPAKPHKSSYFQTYLQWWSQAMSLLMLTYQQCRAHIYIKGKSKLMAAATYIVTLKLRSITGACRLHPLRLSWEPNWNSERRQMTHVIFTCTTWGTQAINLDPGTTFSHLDFRSSSSARRNESSAIFTKPELTFANIK